MIYDKSVLFFVDGIFLTFFDTRSALHALTGIYGVRFLLLPADRVCRTIFRTQTASDTFFRIDRIIEQRFTFACRTFLILDMGDIFIAEMFQCG